MRTSFLRLGIPAACLLALIVSMSVGIPTANAALAYNFTTLDDPEAVGFTEISGISGNTLVGTYFDANIETHGFIYDTSTSTFTTLNYPIATGVSGSNVVGTFYDNQGTLHGYIYDGSTYTTIDDPAANGGDTQINGISGNTVVGSYGGSHGFMYDGTTFTTLDDPLATNTIFGFSNTSASGISGNTVVGYFESGMSGSTSHYGFIYSNGVYTTLDDPLAASNQQGTFAYGIDGGNIVGTYMDANHVYHGFLYNDSTFTTLDDPLAGTGLDQGTMIFGISDDGTIVGDYVDSSGDTHGFIATPVPEPTSGIFLLVGAIALLRRRRRTSMQ